MSKQHTFVSIILLIGGVAGFLFSSPEFPFALQSSEVQGADHAKKLENKIDKFIESKKKYLESSQERMLKEIEKVEKSIERSQLDPDKKVLLLKKIRRDYEHCKSTGQLPSSNELLDIAIKYAKQREGVLNSIEKKRKSILGKQIKSENLSEENNLNELKNRISMLLGDRVEFQKGDNWNGYGVRKAGGSFKLKLKIINVSKSMIEGRLTISRTNGKSEVMKVQIVRTGNNFNMKTTQMISGTRQMYEIHGYVLGSRVVAMMRGKKVTGKKKVRAVKTATGIRKAKRKKNVKRGGEKKIKVTVPKVKLLEAKISLTKRK